MDRETLSATVHGVAKSRTRLSNFTSLQFSLLLGAAHAALVVKNQPANAEESGDAGSIPGLGRSPREGNGNSLQYSCLRNSMDRGAWPATVHGVTNSRTRLHTRAH